jgi:KUP system potassium uptake protein
MGRNTSHDGWCAVLSEGIITPPISVTSAIEGLRQIKLFSDIGQWTIVGIVLVILVILFFLQQFGTSAIGRFFGP